MAVCRALVEQESLDHLVWILQRVHFGQQGKVVGDMGRSRKFNIAGNMRQGRMVSPHLFCAVLQCEIAKMMDGHPNFLDLCFGHDIVIFAQWRVEAGNLLDALVKQLDGVGLLLNANKAVVIMNEGAQVVG